MQNISLFPISPIKNNASNVLNLVFVNDIGNVSVCEAKISVTEVNKKDKRYPPLEISFHTVQKSAPLHQEIGIKCYDRRIIRSRKANNHQAISTKMVGTRATSQKNRQEKLFTHKRKGVMKAEYSMALREFNEFHDVAEIEDNIIADPAALQL